MQLSTDRPGLVAVFKEWQVPLVLELFDGKPMSSREAWKFLGDNDVRAGQKGQGPRPVSRASVINFMNSLVDQGLLDYSLVTGKGGHRRIYRMILTREVFAHKITGQFVNKLLEAFPESKNFRWPRL